MASASANIISAMAEFNSRHDPGRRIKPDSK
jgi:hypothetical protein